MSPASVLNSECAIEANIAIMRAFVHLRELAVIHRDLIQHIDAMELRYDSQFEAILQALDELMERRKPRVPMGFAAPNPPVA